MRYTKLWLGLSAVIVLSFAILGYYGAEIYRQAPPVPERVVTTDGIVLFTDQEIKDGQNVWQSLGGQQVGSIWGHGAYVAPDWSADWLHREATWLLDQWASDAHGRAYAQLDEASQASLRVKLRQEIRTNTYQPATGDLFISPIRAKAIAAVGGHYTALFSNDPSLKPLRDAYAIPANALPDPQRRQASNAFFFWTAWACGHLSRSEQSGSMVSDAKVRPCPPASSL